MAIAAPIIIPNDQKIIYSRHAAVRLRQFVLESVLNPNRITQLMSINVIVHAQSGLNTNVIEIDTALVGLLKNTNRST